MKTWFAKLKISAALDEPERERSCPREDNPGEPGGQSCPRSELAQFEHSMRALHQRLKTAPREREVPSGLHARIMGSVRQAARRPVPRWQWMLRWTPAAALAALALFVIWSAPDVPPPNAIAPEELVQATSLSAAADTLEFSHALTHKAPPAAVSALSEEMDRVMSDLRRTAEFVLASLPLE